MTATEREKSNRVPRQKATCGHSAIRASAASVVMTQSSRRKSAKHTRVTLENDEEDRSDAKIVPNGCNLRQRWKVPTEGRILDDDKQIKVAPSVLTCLNE